MFQIALGNILKFRKKNWQFDFIGGIIYFVLVFSMFPQVIFVKSSTIFSKQTFIQCYLSRRRKKLMVSFLVIINHRHILFWYL